MTKAMLALTAASLLAAGTAQAGPVNHREHRQAHRIGQGVHSGKLTRRETARLAGQQAHIRAKEYRYRHNDGELGPRERIDLQRDQNRASRNIYHQKHDGQSRP